MSVIKFPKSPVGGDPGPRKIYVCAPSHEDLLQATRKIGFGYSKKDAQTRFYEGGLNHGIETRVSNLKTAPDWLKFWLMNQFMMHVRISVHRERRDRSIVNGQIGAS